MFGHCKQFFIGKKVEGMSIACYWMSLLFFVGCAGSPKSLRGLLLCFRLPFPFYSTYECFHTDTTYRGWRVLCVGIGFRVAAGKKIPNVRRFTFPTEVFSKKTILLYTREQYENRKAHYA